jgi:predicted signal transduction protein with EAL and GGDEF domain
MALEEYRNSTIDFVPEENRPETLELWPEFSRGILSQEWRRNAIPKPVEAGGRFHQRRRVFGRPDGKPEGFVNTLQDITERRKKDEELKYVAYHDTLTGLPNRKSFYMCLDDLLQHAGRRNSDRSWA